VVPMITFAKLATVPRTPVTERRTYRGNLRPTAVVRRDAVVRLYYARSQSVWIIFSGRVANYGSAPGSDWIRENIRLRRDDRNVAANNGAIVVDYDRIDSGWKTGRHHERNRGRAH